MAAADLCWGPGSRGPGSLSLPLPQEGLQEYCPKLDTEVESDLGEGLSSPLPDIRDSSAEATHRPVYILVCAYVCMHVWHAGAAATTLSQLQAFIVLPALATEHLNSSSLKALPAPKAAVGAKPTFL